MKDPKMILEMFLTESKKIIEQIKQNHSNIETVHFQVHALKGIVGNIGAIRLFEYIKKIDSCFKENKSLENEDWMKNLGEMYEEAVEEIKKVL